MLRLIASLSLPGEAQLRLRERGYIYCKDLRDSTGAPRQSATDLLKHWHLTVDDIEKTLSPPITSSALDLLQEQCSHRSIVSFCQELDEILDGGVPVSLITELCGPPGSAKTQICLQLCVDIRIPKTLGGLEAEAIFISTDNGFSLKRLHDMSKSCLHHCQSIASNFDADEELKSMTLESMLKGIHYIETRDHVELIATVQLIRDFLQTNTMVKLIVIDSLAFSFRDGEIATLERTGLLYRLLDELQSLSTKHNLAVVVTNQLTTKVIPGKESQLIPALGDSFGHRVNLRLMLGSISGNKFAAILFKSPTKPRLSANFQVTQDGIRDIAH